MTEKKPPYVMVVVRMIKPYGLLFLKKPELDDILEAVAEAIRERQIDDHFEISQFDITEDIEGSFAER